MIWTKDEIVRTLKKLHKAGEDLSYNALARKRQPLVSAAAYHFGSYRKAVERAGIDYAAVTRRPRWTKQAIITLIKKARRNGQDLHWSAVTKRRDELGLAAFASLQPRLFGRWDKALQAAGLDADEVAIYRKWNRPSILFELRDRARERQPINSGTIQREDAGLHAAAVRHFGSYDAAMRAAKLDPEKHRRRRRWTKAAVTQDLKTLYKGKRTPSTAAIREGHSALYGAATRLFGGLPAAIKAKVPPPKPLTPAEELKTFKLPPGFKIEAVATDPMIEDPIAATWDADGRLWVVEYRGYMHDIDGAGENQPLGRISILEDTD